MKRTNVRKPARRSPCPVAACLDIVGDRWTMLVVRDLFHGRSRFGEFEAAPESIPTNILAERLSRLEKAGIVSRKRYQDNPPRFSYLLTDRGRDLKGVLGAMADWGLRHVPGTHTMAGSAVSA